jgi:ABC-2 type transport system ATP-binding protein
MLEAIQLSKTYGAKTALDRLDLTVSPGEIYCMLGANGAGKTTTINLFMGFISATSGKAKVNGVEVKAGSPETKPYIAYIPEQVMLYPTLTGLQNLSFFSGLSGKDHSKEKLEALLLRAGLQSDALHMRVHAYSKGMRQKVGIAIALAKEARVLLLDEPTSGLDPYASNELSGVIRALSRDGMAVLMATHDLFRAKEDGHRIGIMSGGRLVRELVGSETSLHELESEYLGVIESSMQFERNV